MPAPSFSCDRNDHELRLHTDDRQAGCLLQFVGLRASHGNADVLWSGILHFRCSAACVRGRAVFMDFLRALHQSPSELLKILEFSSVVLAPLYGIAVP